MHAKGRENLAELVRRGVLVAHAQPRLYVYAQRMGEHRQTGLVACAAVDGVRKAGLDAGQLARLVRIQVDGEIVAFTREKATRSRCGCARRTGCATTRALCWPSR